MPLAQHISPLSEPLASLSVIPVKLPEDAALWDAFVAQCPMATLLHTQLFLSYHGQRFTDASLWIQHEGEPVGLIPAAISPSNSSTVVSHPGVTFGGLLHAGNLTGMESTQALQMAKQYYAQQGFSQWLYKAVPAIYHQQPAQGDMYGLHQLGATVSRCDISATVDLPNRPAWNKKRTKNMKQVAKHNIEVRCDSNQLELFWPLLETRLAEMHQASPVHSYSDIKLLCSRFPNNIKCWGGYKDDRLVGGTIIFYSPTVAHTQYIAANDEGRKVAALDAILEATIVAATNNGHRYFDFGHSHYRCPDTEAWLFNDSLHKFKCKFGASESIYQTFTIQL